MDQPLPRSTPEEEGVASEAILTFLDSLEGGNFQVHSFMFLRHGRVIAEAWWQPYDSSCRRYLYSLSKSFTSTAVGFAVQEGLLTVDDRVTSFFPDDLPDRIDQNLAAMQVKHLLTMSTGHDVDTTIMMLPEGLVNWAQSILSISVAYPPGTHFLYNSGATYLLSCIVQRLTGQTVLDYLTPRLFTPLGISGMIWDACPRGINTGGWGLSLKTEDLAKFGQLYLQKGVWEGRQLLSPTWINEATRAQIDTVEGEPADQNYDWQQGYGYQFWRCQHNAFRGDGAYGQYCIVLPEQEAVLVITSETPAMQDVMDRIWLHLLPGMGSTPWVAQPRDGKRLAGRLASLRVPVPAAGKPMETVEKLSGKRFLLKENPYGIKAISLSFEAKASRLWMWDASREYQIVSGNGDWHKGQTCLPLMQPALLPLMLRKRAEESVKVAAAGRWSDPQTYIMIWQYLETPHSNRLTFRFHGNEVELEVTSSLEDPHNPVLRNTKQSLSGRLEASTKEVI